MRIVGYIEDPAMKITVLQMNNRISIKFEWDLMEQTYKLNLGNSSNIMTLLESKLSVEFRRQVMNTFQEMKSSRQQLNQAEDINDIGFPEII